MKSFSVLRATATAAAFSLAGSAAFSQEVEIAQNDGTMVLKGELLSVENEIYTLKTSIGTFKIPVATSTCNGEGCPKFTVNFTSEIIATDDISQAALDSIIEGLAAKNEMEVFSEEASGGVAVYKFNDLDGVDQGTIKVRRVPLNRATGDLAAGRAGLVISASGVDPAQAQRIAASGGPNLLSPESEHIVAVDAFVPLVNATNDVSALSIDDFADIASGRIENWSELGGPDAPIRMILPAEDTTDFEYINEKLIQPYRIRLDAGVERMATAEKIAQEVKKDPYAITFASQNVASELKVLPMQRVCGILAYPSDFAIKAEEYPFTRRIRMYSHKRNLSAGVNPMLEFATSPDSQAVLQFRGLQGQSISVEPISSLGDRLAGALVAAPNPNDLRKLQDFVDDIAFASRMSTAFRFVSGSSRLDNKSVQDIKLVSNYLKERKAGIREILLLGFTDDVGREDVNTELALSRAETVRNALLTELGGQISSNRIKVSSFGPLAPVDCNDTLEGRASNRRVEIWLR